MNPPIRQVLQLTPLELMALGDMLETEVRRLTSELQHVDNRSLRYQLCHHLSVLRDKPLD